MPGRLTSDEVDFFKNQGYLLYHKPVLPPARFEALRQHFENKLSTWAQDSGGKRPEHMDVPHFTDPKLFDWLFDPNVLDVVESLIGPDIALWSSHFITKPANTGLRVPWHEDSAYWGKVLDPMEVVTVWLAVDPSTPANGCMRVIPGTHHNGYSQYEDVQGEQVFGIQIKQGMVDESKAVDCALAPNECSVHHAKTIHGSNPNTSPLRRCGYTMRYVPASSKFRPEQMWAGAKSAFQIYLARGKDTGGNEYGDPTKVNQMWVDADFEAKRRAKLLAG